MKRIALAGVLNLAVVAAFAQGGAVTSAATFQQQGVLDKAKEQIDKATEHEKTKDKAKTWFYRGEIYRGIAADQTGAYAKLDTNAAEKSYEAYQKAVELEPDKPFGEKAATALKEMHLSVGGVKYQRKQYDEALTLFNKAVEANPKDTAAVLYAGITAQQLKKYDDAAKNFEKLIEMDTKMSDVYTTLASIYRSQEKNDEALAVIKKGLQKFPADKTMKAEEFNLYVASGKTDEAKKNLEEAIQKEPNNATSHLNLGLLYDQTGDKEKAAESFQKALQIDPNNFEANLSLGVVHYNKGADISKKIRDMDLKQYQKEGPALEKELKSHFEKALPYFEKGYQVKPDDPNVLQPLSSIYGVLGMKEKEAELKKKMEGMN